MSIIVKTKKKVQPEKVFVVYKITCKENLNLFYIGSSNNLCRRKIEHKSICKNPNSHSYHLKVYDIIRNNGNFENFEFDIIETVELQKDLKDREEYYIKILKPLMNTAKGNTSKKEREYHKQYNIKNGRNEKIVCDCSGSYDAKHKNDHINTKKHKDYLLHTEGTNQSE